MFTLADCERPSRFVRYVESYYVPATRQLVDVYSAPDGTRYHQTSKGWSEEVTIPSLSL